MPKWACGYYLNLCFLQFLLMGLQQLVTVQNDMGSIESKGSSLVETSEQGAVGRDGGWDFGVCCRASQQSYAESQYS